MLDAVWTFLSNSENQDTLAWIGGGLATAVSALWIAVKHFGGQQKPANGASPKGPSAVQGIAASGDVRVDGNINIAGPAPTPNWVYGLGILGLLLLGFAIFSSGDTMTVTNGSSYVGGSVKDSEIHINGNSSGDRK